LVQRLMDATFAEIVAVSKALVSLGGCSHGRGVVRMRAAAHAACAPCTFVARATKLTSTFSHRRGNLPPPTHKHKQHNATTCTYTDAHASVGAASHDDEDWGCNGCLTGVASCRYGCGFASGCECVCQTARVHCTTMSCSRADVARNWTVLKAIRKPTLFIIIAAGQYDCNQGCQRQMDNCPC
jgi:hypothetical protein